MKSETNQARFIHLYVVTPKTIREESQLPHDANSDDYIQDLKKECAKSSMSSLRLLVKQELTSAEQKNSQINYLIRGLNEIELSEKEEQVVKLYPDPADTLKERKKQQHLNYGERLHIYKEIAVHKIDRNEISSRYKLSDSTIRNIMREFSMRFSIPKLKDLKRSGKIMHSTVVRKCINNFISSDSGPFWSRDVAKAVKQDLGISLQVHNLIKYMKKNLGLSFKKGTSRPANLNI